MKSKICKHAFIDNRIKIRPEQKGSEVVPTEFYCPECWNKVGRFDRKCKRCGEVLVEKAQ